MSCELLSKTSLVFLFAACTDENRAGSRAACHVLSRPQPRDFDPVEYVRPRTPSLSLAFSIIATGQWTAMAVSDLCLLSF